jgi:hypothetical protein
LGAAGLRQEFRQGVHRRVCVNRPTAGTRNELTPTKEHTMKTTTNNGTAGRPTLALRRRSIRTLTTDELRRVHGGNTSPTAATTNGQTGTNVRESLATVTAGTTVIRQSGNSASGTSIIRQAPQSQ